MVLGTRDILSPETETLFRFFGLTHLLVLSGFQVTLVFTLVHQALMSVRWLLWRHVDRLPLEPLATLGGLSVAVGLVACTGFEASGNRALIAVVLAAGADAYEARWSGSLAIVGVAFIMELLWPLVVFEPGAALTFAALVGLQLGRRYGNGFFAAVVSSLGASLCVSAVSMIWFPPPSWYGMLVGLMVTPVFSFVILWGAIVGLGVDLLSGGGVSGLLSGSAYLVEMLTLCLEWLRRVIVDSGWG
jgi:competence protein ComEC